MRSVLLTLGLALALPLALAAPAAAGPTLKLTDEKLPLWQIRPLDRRVWVLTLDGAWTDKQPPAGAAYNVLVSFPDGGTYTHRILDESLFRSGEVRCLLPEYILVRHGVARSGSFTVAVTQRNTPSAPAEVISNAVSVAWPLARPVVPLPPTSKATPPRPIDDFPGGEEIRPPAPKKTNPPLPPPTPKKDQPEEKKPEKDKPTEKDKEPEKDKGPEKEPGKEKDPGEPTSK